MDVRSATCDVRDRMISSIFFSFSKKKKLFNALSECGVVSWRFNFFFILFCFPKQWLYISHQNIADSYVFKKNKRKKQKKPFIRCDFDHFTAFERNNEANFFLLKKSNNICDVFHSQCLMRFEHILHICNKKVL